MTDYEFELEKARAERRRIEIETAEDDPTIGYYAGLIEERWQDWLPAVAPKTYSAGFEWFHADFWDWYWPILKLRQAGEPVPDDKPLTCFLPWGRGLGKSACLEGLALAEGAQIKGAFGVYLSSTQQKAEEHLQSVRALIESSAISNYYPHLSKPRVGKFGNQRGWRADAVYAGDFAIVCCSLEQGVRGLRDEERRPTFILLDDIDERKDSLEIKAKKFETITRDVLPMLAPFGLAVLGQNLIYAGSIADDTLQRKLDWLHGCKIVGVPDGISFKPINTYQDDLRIEKLNGIPIIVAGTPNWARLDRAVSQSALQISGEKAFLVESQNQTAPDPEERVWKTFNPSLSVITWEQFGEVFGTPRIRSDFNLYGGYDRGATGPDKHPATFSVAAVAPERTPLAGDVFIFYEYVAPALEDVGDMAAHLIEDLALLCEHSEIREATRLIAQAKGNIPESSAWELRGRAGRLIPFKLFNGSHEGLSERTTLRQKWGLPVQAGKAGKTEGLEQLHHYAKPEAKPNPFFPHLVGRPNLWLVVRADQYLTATDRWGLQRTRWEAANLKWDKNITTRDVPTKFGDDVTDAIKHYLQTFALTGQKSTYAEKLQAAIPEPYRYENLRATQPQGDGLADMAEMAYLEQLERAKKTVQKSGVARFDQYGRRI